MKLSLNALYSTLTADLMPFLPTRVVDDFISQSGKYPSVNMEEVLKDGELHPKQVAALSLLDSVFKKYTEQVVPEANDLAMDKFLSANRSCKDWELKTNSLLEDHLVGEFKDSLHRFFIPSNAEPSILAFSSEFFERGGLGPGASVGARGGDFYTKLYDGPLTCTSSGLYRMYRNYIRDSYSAEAGESARIEHYGEYDVVEGSKLSFVPKNDCISRVICTEPVLNMWAQKGVGELITGRLNRRFGIDLSVQPDINRELARVGSLDDNLSTIDLSSASDSIGLEFCRTFLPQPVMEVLEVLRCKRTAIQPKDFITTGMRSLCEAKGGWLELDMISSMGNGFTFPLETAIFACAVEAVYRVFDIPMIKSSKRLKHRDCSMSNGFGYLTTVPMPVKYELGNFGVFGDDIICKSDVAPQVIRLLELCGFTTNASKSFVKGPFRESCGGDFYKGFPVRGVYIKHLRTAASRYVAINRLNRWSAVTGISLSKTIRLLVSSVRRMPVPLHENDDAGIKVTHNILKKLIRAQQGFSRQSYETDISHSWEGGPVLGKWDLKRIARSESGAWLYKRWIVNPERLLFLEDAVVTPKWARKRYYNAHGPLCAFLHGNIEDGTVTIRHDRTRYLTKTAPTPPWDCVPTAASSDAVGPERWDSALWLNLMI